MHQCISIRRDMSKYICNLCRLINLKWITSGGAVIGLILIAYGNLAVLKISCLHCVRDYILLLCRMVIRCCIITVHKTLSAFHYSLIILKQYVCEFRVGVIQYKFATGCLCCCSLSYYVIGKVSTL